MEDSNVMFSEKGKKIYIIEGYKFSFHKLLKNDIERWRCIHRSCKSFFKYNENQFIDQNLTHNHNCDSEKILNRQILNNNLKRKAQDDICEKPSKLLHSEIKNNDIDTLTRYDCTLIKKNIHNARKNILPNIPQSYDEVHKVLNDLNIKTNRQENFLLINDNQYNIVIFCTVENLNFLSNMNTFYVDGTFKSCPKIFMQMFTIHTIHNNHYIPLIFCLLPNKQKEIYTQTFRMLCNECEKLNLKFLPQTIYVDFEEAIHNSILSVWPEINIKGCRFHLGQSWWRKIQNLGLTNEYKSDSELSKYLKYFFGLPFLHPEEVENCFIEDIMSIQPNDSKIREFTDYVFDNYINEESRFPPKIWSEFNASTMRTTNSCESFHSHFNSMFYTAHPNIYQFLEILKNVQIDTYIKMRSVEVMKKRNCILLKEKFIADNMNKKIAGIINRFDFVKLMSYKFLPTHM